jgi:hypothetical protein
MPAMSGDDEDDDADDDNDDDNDDDEDDGYDDDGQQLWRRLPLPVPIDGAL